MIIAAQIYILICILFLAGKDATSYLLKDKNSTELPLEKKRIQRWHRDGVILNILFLIPIVCLDPKLYLIVVYALLIRLSIFDLAFNYWAKLDYKYLGSTAKADQILNKVFGEQGAVKKSLFFALILVIMNVLLK